MALAKGLGGLAQSARAEAIAERSGLDERQQVVVDRIGVRGRHPVREACGAARVLRTSASGEPQAELGGFPLTVPDCGGELPGRLAPRVPRSLGGQVAQLVAARDAEPRVGPVQVRGDCAR